MGMLREINSLSTIASDDLEELLLLADWLQEKQRRAGALPDLLRGFCLGMIFDEVSLRTRSAFERAAYDLGGNAIHYIGKQIRLGRHSVNQEDLRDLVSVVGGFNDVILSRVYSHEIQRQIAEMCPVPFINGMCDQYHPTQALCDFLTMSRRFGRVRGLKIAFVGDATNVALSLAQVASKLGASFILASPASMRHPASAVAELAGYTVTIRPEEAVEDAHVVVTDAWTPMNKGNEADERREMLSSFRVTAGLMQRARPDAIFLHSLPANRREEVTPEVIDGPQSIVYEEAIARLHVARAILVSSCRADWREIREPRVDVAVAS